MTNIAKRYRAVIGCLLPYSLFFLNNFLLFLKFWLNTDPIDCITWIVLQRTILLVVELSTRYPGPISLQKFLPVPNSSRSVELEFILWPLLSRLSMVFMYFLVQDRHFNSKFWYSKNTPFLCEKGTEVEVWRL